jgi:hypothetical protein
MQAALYQMRDRLTPNELAALRASHAMTAPSDGLKPNLKCEQFFFDDVVQYVFTDDGNGNGRLIPSQYAKITDSMVGPASQPQAGADITKDAYLIGIAAVHADRRETVAKYNDVLDRAVEFWSLPLYDPRRADGDALVRKMQEDATESKRFAVITTILPNLSRADQLIRETAMSQMATRTIIALLSYRADHGTLPERLVEITPKYLAELPTDVYSGMLLRYSHTADGEWGLYSVGRNLKDDGGSMAKVPDTGRPDGTVEADFVYWPLN